MIQQNHRKTYMERGGTDMDKLEKLSLEESFELLDELLEKLEDRDTTLEESFSLYQKGMNLLRLCNDKIDTVEKKILIMNEEGGLDEF